MKGDFSSMSFAGSQPYSRVLMQQGRVQLDTDWNTQAELFARAQRDMARAMFGHSGAPAANPGFGIQVWHGLRFAPHACVHIAACSTLELDAGRPFTLEVRVGAGPGGGGLIGNLDQSRPAPGSFALSVLADGTLRFECARTHAAGHGGHAAHAAIWHVDSWRALPFDQPCHVVVCGDGERIALYLDDELVASAALPPTGAAAPHPLYLGARVSDGRPVDGLQGVLYMVAAWSQACTPGQLRAAHRQPRRHRHPALLGAWYFDEPGGDRVVDAGIHGHHGYLERHGGDGRLPERTGPEIWIGSGQFYVDGLLCRNERPRRLADQPAAGSGSHLLYLDVWERYLSALEAPGIAEPALGGADTTGRVQTVCQVRLGSHAGLAERRRQAHSPWRIRAAFRDGVVAQENQLYRVELHHAGALRGSTPGRTGTYAIEHAHTHSGTVKLAHWDDRAARWSPGQPLEFFDGQRRIDAMLLGSDAASRTLHVSELPPNPQHWRLRALASFKWSRDNAALAYAVESVDGLTVRLAYHEPGQQALQSGDWVELVDDDLTMDGLPGMLCHVGSVEIDLDGCTTLALTPPEGVTSLRAPGRHALLRRWDDPAALGGGAPSQASLHDKHDLGDGVHIEFDGDGDGEGEGRSGDYWTFTIRDGDGAIGWPEQASPGAWVAPQGIRHHYAELAMLHLEPGCLHVDDLRRVFGAQDQLLMRSGDTMDGPLAIDAELSVAGAARFAGRVEVGELHGRLAGATVGSAQLQEHAVTHAKLEPGLGLVPAGFAILGASAHPPHGYHYSGTRVTAQRASADWMAFEAPPAAWPGTTRGRCHLATWDEHLVAVFEHSCEVWQYGRREGSPPQWHPAPPMPRPGRHSFAVAIVDGGLHVLGGRETDGSHSTRNERFDLLERHWQPRAALPLALGHLAAAAMDGCIHVVGGELDRRQGWRRSSLSDSHHRYDPRTNAWELLPALPEPNARLSLCARHGVLYAMGGMQDSSLIPGRARLSRAHYAYHAGGARWRSLAPLPQALCDSAGCAAHESIYLAGGRTEDGASRLVLAFDPVSGNWQTQVPMQAGRAGFGLAYWADGLLAAGGADDGSPMAEHCLLAQVLHVHIKSEEGK